MCVSVNQLYATLAIDYASQTCTRAKEPSKWMLGTRHMKKEAQGKMGPRPGGARAGVGA